MIPYEIITNESATFIYQDGLYDEEGELIAALHNIGTDWEASTDLGEYFGLNAANEVIYPALTGSKTPTSKLEEIEKRRWEINCP